MASVTGSSYRLGVPWLKSTEPDASMSYARIANAASKNVLQRFIKLLVPLLYFSPAPTYRAGHLASIYLPSEQEPPPFVRLKSQGAYLAYCNG